MKIEKLLAIGMVPHIRLRYGPGVGDAVSIDASLFDLNKQELIEFCRSIPNTDEGLSWRILKAYTDNNGTMAKVLIALGELAGVWTMHPPLHVPALWNRMHPMILAGSVRPQEGPTASRVPKPSRGDLEAGTTSCRCCRRPMGAVDSMTHDLVDVGEGYCIDCDAAGCDTTTACKVFHAAEIHEEAPAELEPPDAIEAYLRQFE